MRFPHLRKPCIHCPFRKDTLRGWLGESKMKGILESASFKCHKTTDKQCAGHMLIRGEKNQFVQLANRLKVNLELSGRESVFDTEEDCINHHNFRRIR